MKLLKLSPTAYEYYKREVRGNENISFDQARRKLSRDVQLVKEFAPEIIFGLYTKSYRYGNLLIRVKGRKIVDIENHKGRQIKWNIDEKRYIELTREYGIKVN